MRIEPSLLHKNVNRHDIAEILLKAALCTTNQSNQKRRKHFPVLIPIFMHNTEELEREITAIMSADANCDINMLYTYITVIDKRLKVELSCKCIA